MFRVSGRALHLIAVSGLGQYGRGSPDVIPSRQVGPIRLRPTLELAVTDVLLQQSNVEPCFLVCDLAASDAEAFNAGARRNPSKESKL